MLMLALSTMVVQVDSGSDTVVGREGERNGGLNT
jgi:hypothetical protein